MTKRRPNATSDKRIINTKDLTLPIQLIWDDMCVFVLSMDLEERHGRQAGGEAEQHIIGDQEEPLDDDNGLVPQQVGQQEDWEQDGQVGVRPHGEQVVGHLLVRE